MASLWRPIWQFEFVTLLSQKTDVAVRVSEQWSTT